VNARIHNFQGRTADYCFRHSNAAFSLRKRRRRLVFLVDHGSTGSYTIGMRSTLLIAALGIVLLGATSDSHGARPNKLTRSEKAAGWKLLFDGRNTDAWRGAKSESFPERGWSVQEGWLHCSGEKAGDLLTKQRFEQFELQFEWKIEKGGNSGVKYFVVEPRGLSLGHEYQLIDDANHPDAGLAEGKRLTASFYDVIARRPDVKPRPFGEINTSRIVVRGNHVEHWLNGQMAVEYECGSTAVMGAVAASKFRSTQDFGKRLPGRIQLQDHQSKVWFRNIKIRVLNGAKEGQ